MAALGPQPGGPARQTLPRIRRHLPCHRPRRGKKIATTAIARKLLTRACHLLATAHATQTSTPAGTASRAAPTAPQTGRLRPARLARGGPAPAPRVTAVAYDRRGYGESAVSTAPFTHVDDLVTILDHEHAGRPWLAGASAGGGQALDAALLAPDRVAGLVLLGTAVSGAPEPELDPDTQRFDALLDAAMAAGNLDEVNRLETWRWLDGPSSAEGRVGGQARTLALEMNAIILRNGAREDEGGSGVNAWRRLDEIQVRNGRLRRA